MRRPVAAEHPLDAGEADCHSPAGFAMTCFFVSVYFSLSAESIENYRHCEPVRTLAWQSVPLIAQQCVGPKGRQCYSRKRFFIVPFVYPFPLGRGAGVIFYGNYELIFHFE